jgi:hypothetical protein
MTYLFKYLTVSSNFLISEAWDVLSSFISSWIKALLDWREFSAFTASYQWQKYILINKLDGLDMWYKLQLSKNDKIKYWQE